MRVKVLFTIFVMAGIAAAAATTQTGAGPINKWSDTTRDVYIDNELDRGAQVLTADSPSRLAFISTKFESAVVLDIAEHSIRMVSKEAFQFGSDRTSATSDSNVAMKAIGKFTRVDGPVYFFVIDGKPVLIRSHPGAIGELSMDKLWETVPVWQYVMKAYEPNAEAVKAIEAIDKDTLVTLAFGTWCPDSKKYVPRLIKA